MKYRWSDFSEQERGTLQIAIAFLSGRLEERDTINWALKLTPSDRVKRVGVVEIINSPRERQISEPWRTSWRLIEESWNNQIPERDTISREYWVAERLKSGDKSGSMIEAIVDLVAPRLEVKSRQEWPGIEPQSMRKRKPKSPSELFYCGLTSGEISAPSKLKLADTSDRHFLAALARGLEGAISKGLDIAKRIGWREGGNLWRLGDLHRVYFASAQNLSATDEHEPDAYHRGIAPSVKLLHSVVSRLNEVDPNMALGIIQRWKLTDTIIHQRLWAAFSRDPAVTPASEVSEWLLNLNNSQFWDVHLYPEIAELRALRFAEFGAKSKRAIISRIRRRPPKSFWTKDIEVSKVNDARLYWVVREMKRLQIAGAKLTPADEKWLADNISKFTDLQQMNRIDEGFLHAPKAGWVLPDPDHKFDTLSGLERLKQLEADLLAPRDNWDKDRAERAWDWIREGNNTARILEDLESTDNAGAQFQKLWDLFGMASFTNSPSEAEHAGRNISDETIRTLRLIKKLPPETIHGAIEGLSRWLSYRAPHVVSSPEGFEVWNLLWPEAVNNTNSRQKEGEAINLSTVAWSESDHEPLDSDTLNTPVGELLDVYFKACPNLSNVPHPFSEGTALRQMRDQIASATERSDLIARYRMVEELPYFLRADPDWAQDYLVKALADDNEHALALWRAAARRGRFGREVQEQIGYHMVMRATDLRLGRETRQRIVFRLVVECLHSILEKRNQPPVPHKSIQQMLRNLDDEVRASAAGILPQFLREMQGTNSPSAEELFTAAVEPFLRTVWPQEYSFATPGVSHSFAGIPALSKGAFSQAVKAIERYLVPFECWSMHEYWLFGEEDGAESKSLIDNPDKADALLRLLDLTIGTAEGSVIPYDLNLALEQIRIVDSGLTSSPAFRRLETATRRIS
jgi:hypothetical protein